MRRALPVLAILCAAAGACAPDDGALEREARNQVFQKLSAPDMAVVVGPAVMQDRFAIVDFTRGSFTGGRALMRRDKAAWVFVLCGGEPLRKRPAVERAGVPDGVAGVLIAKLLREESRVSDERRGQLDKWKSLGPSAACPEAP